MRLVGSPRSSPIAALWPVQAPDSAKVVHQISQRVIRKLRKLGSLESGIDATVATGHDPLVHHEPELARRLAAGAATHCLLTIPGNVRRMGCECPIR